MDAMLVNRTRRDRRVKTAKPRAHRRKLTLAELWDLSKRIGLPSKSESIAIVRKMRDERYGR